jgi:hypothetical protein
MIRRRLSKSKTASSDMAKHVRGLYEIGRTLADSTGQMPGRARAA